jgi:hypothetical protein
MPERFIPSGAFRFLSQEVLVQFVNPLAAR